MKISVITVVLNRCDVILEALESLRSQTYQNFEHIIVDGGSTDGTVELIRGTLQEKLVVVSEPDNGLYDALNKGILLAKGDVIGVLHSDDVYYDNKVLEDVKNEFENGDVDAVYGDLVYVNQRNPWRIIRYWISGKFYPRKLRFGWMPPHPALFLRKRAIDRYGGYDDTFSISADYDLILRYFSTVNFKVSYLPRVLVKMRMGGVSNGSVNKIFCKSIEDLAAIRRNKVGGFPTLFLKNLRKINQFFRSV